MMQTQGSIINYNFCDVSKVKFMKRTYEKKNLDTDLKIILLDLQNNYVGIIKHDE